MQRGWPLAVLFFARKFSTRIDLAAVEPLVEGVAEGQPAAVGVVREK
jgi:hypothetical protein